MFCLRREKTAVKYLNGVIQDGLLPKDTSVCVFVDEKQTTRIDQEHK